MTSIDRYQEKNRRAVLLRDCLLGEGRPFPWEEAEARFAGLRGRGLRFARLVLTWEDLEGEGPGVYNEAYLAWLRKLLLGAEKQGITVFIHPRQEGWSRPAWILEKLGMDGGIPGDDPGGYRAATLCSLFFGGNTYAPEAEIDGESAQDWLQGRYIAALRHCFRRLKNCRALGGWGIMDGLGPAFIGCRDLREGAGSLVSPFEAISAAAGAALFKSGYGCPWKRAGVWTDEGGEIRLLRPDHFARFQGRDARFAGDFLKPFILRFIERMREAGEKTLFFIEGAGEDPFPPGESPQGLIRSFPAPEGGEDRRLLRWEEGFGGEAERLFFSE